MAKRKPLLKESHMTSEVVSVERQTKRRKIFYGPDGIKMQYSGDYTKMPNTDTRHPHPAEW